MSSTSSTSNRKSSTLSINVSRNKPLPPIILDNSQAQNQPQPQLQTHNINFNSQPQSPSNLSSPTIKPLNLPGLTLAGPSSSHSPTGGSAVGGGIGGNAAGSMFQPKTLKRRNLKKLTLNDEQESNSTPSINSPNHSLKIPTPNSSTSNKHNEENLELLENFEKLTITINNQYNLKQQDLLTLKTLGEGQSGSVSKILHVPTNKTMAKKQIMFEKNFKVQNQILRELKILNDVKNPYIIEFYGAIFIDSASSTSTSATPTTATEEKHKDSKDDLKIPKDFNNEVPGIRSNGVMICMEYMDCGSLDYILKKLGFLKEVYSSKITYAILQGLNYLYANHKIIHRDIKPSNVLLNSKGEVKICDFGVSRELNNNSIADTFVGTSTYMSPERIQGDVYSIKGDVWSLGLMLIELSTGEFPFGKKDTPNGILDLLQRIVNEEPPSLSKSKFSKELCDFVELCLKKQNERPTPLELLQMPKSFITKYQTEDSRQLLRHLAKKLRKPKK
ncbi:hypothetical protein BN7_3720 [Wickerhamomyces ciferrii]|uniref:mitogen-activated protein kinase kinase n=1 Tax=Wickerhamomyces ciferrii (strain ATCC 14091 / BCRC 22168 / CBS 111 / JCM 3599 / NBRC 0793 / NRRL Y-1031 F-60-10) TaxID=1206466 RepID=K0KPS1_WICCF|nr:uncharacterized protein BN7_3720 [Wickerhamomyces ciferrii]CCH44162.1 hypothetical protein BN7_3720 [Wickerhamomyces ciferrii]